MNHPMKLSLWKNVGLSTIFALSMPLIKAEELGLSSQNIDSLRGRENPVIRRFLGEEGPVGKSLGLQQGWTYQMIKQVGNYGELYSRNLGAGSPLKMRRRLNNLWASGGLLAAPTFR